jgi:hypothetical protein
VRIALASGLAALLPGCIGVGQFVSERSGESAPQELIEQCREQAQRQVVTDIDALPASPKPEGRIGSEIGNSLGDALNFRRDVAQCLRKAGYVRAR